MRMPETLTISSTEGFLGSDEIDRLRALMSTHLAGLGTEAIGSGRKTSVHSVPGVSTEAIMNIFEPAGRVELDNIPATMTAILDQALDRNWARLKRSFPSANSHRPWVYFEYGQGQFITPHADGIGMDLQAWPRQVCAASVTIYEGSGGSFFVETTGAEVIWDRPISGPGYGEDMWAIREGSDYSSPWFRETARTRWTVEPALGTLIAFGSQLVHGTTPVNAGRVGKFLTLLVQDCP